MPKTVTQLTLMVDSVVWVERRLLSFEKVLTDEHDKATARSLYEALRRAREGIQRFDEKKTN